MRADNVYAIGDIHGCLKSLEALIARLPDDAHIIFLGDAVNRGAHSLECLRFIRNLGERATYILGNHEMHLLAVAAGTRVFSEKDTLQEILDADDADDLIEWLRHLPLAYTTHDTLFVHAGVHPSWDLAKALACAKEVEDAMHRDDWKTTILHIFGNTPPWSEELTGYPRLRAILNILARTRFLHADGSIELKCSNPPDQGDEGLIPWFDYPGRKTADIRVVCGHWSACGLICRDNLLTLDTGCCWGQKLTAARIPDIKFYQTEGIRT